MEVCSGIFVLFLPSEWQGKITIASKKRAFDENWKFLKIEFRNATTWSFCTIIVTISTLDTRHFHRLTCCALAYLTNRLLYHNQYSTVWTELVERDWSKTYQTSFKAVNALYKDFCISSYKLKSWYVICEKKFHSETSVYSTKPSYLLIKLSSS